MRRPRWKTFLRGFALSVVGLFLLAQLVPYGRHRANPAVVAEPPWDGPATRALTERACFDCHSNETRWPWYSRVAPMSWLLQIDVDEGREALNFSAWNRPHQEAREAGETVLVGSMPPRRYLLFHTEARLTPAERTALARGLDASLGGRRSSRARD